MSNSRQTYRWIMLAALLLLAVAVIWHSPEPSYQGKSLSQWAKTLPGCCEDLSPETQAAFTHFGTQAVPLALALCQTKDSYLWKKLVEWSEAWNTRFDYLPIHLKTEDAAQIRGMAAFRAIGPAGAPAIPQLIKLVETGDAETSDTWMVAGSALCSIGTNAVPPLIALLAHPEGKVRMRAASILAGYGHAGRMAEPALLRCLHDPDIHVRSAAASTLGRVSEDSAVIAALLRCLRDPEFGNNDHVASALADIRKEPEIVIPALLDYAATQTNNFSLCVQMALNRYGTNGQPWVPRLAAMIQSGQYHPIYTRMLLSTLSRMDSNLAAPMITAWEQAHPRPPMPPEPSPLPP